MIFAFGFGLIPQSADRAAAAGAPTASFTNYYVGASNQGFEPGDGKKLSVKVKYRLKKNGFKGTCRVRLRILNGEGKYVYQKLWTIKKSGSKTVKWDGKASAGNKAGVTAGSYIKGGIYRAEVAVRYQAAGTTSWKTATKQTRAFIIAESTDNASSKNDGTADGTGSSKDDGTALDNAAGTENSGSTGVPAETSVIPVFTGNKYIDYVAELMIQEAGITAETTEDEKVRLIYNYMTTHFHHVHYNKANKYTVYYKTTTKLKSAIAAYGKEMKKRKKAGEIKYDSVSSGILWNMKRRIGECNHHALIFQILCKHVGVEATTCKGYYLNRNGTRAGHYWNAAVVNGTTYYYDVDVEIQNYGKGQGDYYWYKKTLKEARETHEFTSYDVY